MKKKSFYDNYYSGFYSKSGKRLAEGDIVFNAKGDIVDKATGDIVFNAGGDAVQSASGDIVFNGAEGDIVKNAVAPESKSEDDVVTKKKDVGKWFDFADNIFGLAERAVTMKTKWEGGGTVEESGVEFDYQPGSAAPKDNTMWYVIGGVLVLAVIVGFALKAKK